LRGEQVFLRVCIGKPPHSAFDGDSDLVSGKY